MTPADKIALEMRQAAQNFNHRPQSMRGSAFAGLLNSFQTASTPDNILAILDDRDALKEALAVFQQSEAELVQAAAGLDLEIDALKAQVAEMESLLAYVRQSEHRFHRATDCDCDWCEADRDFVRRLRAAFPETTK